MTTQDNNPKVVDFAQRAPAPGERPDKPVDVLAQVRGHAMKRLTGLVTVLFENADDTLFDLASKAENNALQASFFDGMREIRKRRQGIEAKFQERFARHFADFQAGRAAAAAAKSENTMGSGGELSLSLVDDSELEESLAVASMVSKAEGRLQRALFALNQRMAHVANLRVEDSNNPVGPSLVAQMFRESLGETESSMEVKLVVFKLFDRFVLGGLDIVYDELNALMIHSGVLPQLRGVVTRRGSGTGAGPMAPRQPGGQESSGPMADLANMAAGQGGPMPQGYGGGGGYAGGGGSGGGVGYDPVAAEMQANLYGTLRALLTQRREIAGGDMQGDGGGGYGGGGGGYGGPVVNANELLAALSILQGQATTAQSLADSAHVVAQVKDQLLSQAGKLRGEDKAHVAGSDEDTIDLVGMLFEYILQDRNLPAQMQALLGRLQIPFIKVALLDKHLFARRTHPSRQLLDALAEASVGWSEESDRDRRLYDKVKSIVDGLLKEFEDDVGIFDRLRTDFEAFVESNKRRADLAEQRTAEATRGRDKLLGARRQAAREIVQRMEGRELPDLIKNLLTKPWANYLVLVLLRQGETSEEWNAALKFADVLIWSVQPKPDDASRTRLRALLPELEKRLRQGLATVAFDETDVRRLMQQLHVLYAGLLGEEQNTLELTTPGAPAGMGRQGSMPGAQAHGNLQDHIASEPAHDPMQNSGESVLSVLDEEEAAAPIEQVDERCAQMVRELKVGAWIEFTDSQGNSERAKLSWISPISSKYLFVNRKGLKVGDKNAIQLAAEIGAGTATILEEVPLFDRALDAIVERLKTAHAAKAGTTTSSSAQQQPS